MVISILLNTGTVKFLKTSQTVLILKKQIAQIIIPSNCNLYIDLIKLKLINTVPKYEGLTNGILALRSVHLFTQNYSVTVTITIEFFLK